MSEAHDEPLRDDDVSDDTRPLHGPVEADDPRLIEAVQEYVAALEAGKRPNRGELLARHPEIAEQLAACLEGLAFVHAAAGQIPGAVAATPAARGEADEGDLGVGMCDAQPLGDFRLLREIGRGGM
jgi:hypothetical protein